MTGRAMTGLDAVAGASVAIAAGSGGYVVLALVGVLAAILAVGAIVARIAEDDADARRRAVRDLTDVGRDVYERRTRAARVRGGR